MRPTSMAEAGYARLIGTALLSSSTPTRYVSWPRCECDECPFLWLTLVLTRTALQKRAGCQPPLAPAFESAQGLRRPLCRSSGTPEHVGLRQHPGPSGSA